MTKDPILECTSKLLTRIQESWHSFSEWLRKLQEEITGRQPPSWKVFLGIFGLMFLLLFWVAWLAVEYQEIKREITEVIVTKEIWATKVFVAVTRVIEVETKIVEKVATSEAECTGRIDAAIAGCETEVARLTATVGVCTPYVLTSTSIPMPTDTPTLTPTSTDTRTLTPTPTSTNTPTLTPGLTDTPTLTPTPTDTPTPTLTHTRTCTFTPTPTPTDIPTSAPTLTDTPTSTLTPTLPPPNVRSITPISMVRALTGTLPITVTGKHFVATSAVTVGTTSVISVCVPTTTTITGEVPRNMSPYVYPVTVTNPDSKFGSLPKAFTVQDADNRLESPHLATFGREAESPHDKVGFQTQLIFFEVPTSTLSLSDTLHLRIFDADTWGASDMVDEDSFNFDTTISYTLYGLTGTYTVPGASAPRPPIVGIHSGTPLLTATLGVSETWDLRWRSLGSFPVDKGQLVGDRYIFKLAVEGMSGDDGNLYRVALSTVSDMNSVPSGLRMFAFSWTLAVTETNRLYLYPFVRENMATFQYWNFGRDPEREVDRLLFRTPLRVWEARWSPGDGRYMPAEFVVQAGEDGATWTLDFGDYIVDLGMTDFLGFWAEDANRLPLHSFTRPTMAKPP